MVKLLVVFALSLFYFKGFCQEPVDLKLNLKQWNADRKRYYIRKIRPQDTVLKLSSAMRLKNGDSISQYLNFHITVQRETERSSKTYLNLIVAPSSRKNIVIVFDENGNTTFNDDTVYSIPMNEKIHSWDEFYKKLPLIQLDSIVVYNHENKKEYKSIQFKVGISKNDEGFFETLDQVEQANSFMLDIYTVEYYSSVLHAGSNKYEFAVALNPVIQNFAGYPGTSDVDGAVFVYRVLPNKDTLINFIPIGMWNSSSSLIRNNIEAGNHTYQVKSFSYPKKALQIVEAKDNSGYEKADVSKRYDNVNLSEILSDTGYTVIDFSGSWCKPCELILPKFKLLHQAFGKKVKFVTVDVENDYESSEKYQLTKGISWKIVYEDINCNSEQCLVNTFQIFAYPTLILLDKNKKEIFRGEGTESVEQLEKFFITIFKN